VNLKRGVLFSFLCTLALSFASTAHAQQSAWGDLTLSGARIDYDLSGTGNAPALAVRATRHLTSHLLVELGGVVAKPDQQFGPSTLFMPEAQLQYRWRAGRVSPYIGGGIGTALVKSDFHSDWDPTLSVAVGTGVRLTDRLGVTGELRLRGHEWRFVGTTAEISAGLAWRIPSF
jgi:hypothetical protein